jgi:NADPH-dependent glutamate synthase beta subunit-like oxidoreductase
MQRYWDCSLCRIEDKGNASRCRSCCGKLRGRERLLYEIVQERRVRPRAALLSAFAAGLGQVYTRRRGTGLIFAVLIPLAVVLVAVTWHGLTYGHYFLAAAALFVLGVAVLDARLGPTRTVAPCQQTCPAALDIPDYLQLALDGDPAQGYGLIRTKIPLVGVIGRICPHPCEARCARGTDGEPIAINGCKRFLADQLREAKRGGAVPGAASTATANGEILSVGVVGSGPAGIACAYYLNILGARVTVYEAEAVPGGRLATTIPDFRLPPDILDEELRDLRDGGVVFRTGCRVGPDGHAVAELLREHGAVFLGIGAERSMGLSSLGQEGVFDFQEVLRAAKGGHPLPLGRRVAVIGGGNAAMDVCRTLFRWGAEEVHLLYRRTRDEMPARADEVEEAAREGVHFHFLADPVGLRLEGGRPAALTVNRMRLGDLDASGRPRAIPVEGEEWDLPVDAVVPALGQAVGGGLLSDPALADLGRNEDGTLWVDHKTQRTTRERVYAGGDVVSGAGTAVEAMAQGRKAALAIFADLAAAQLPNLRLSDRRLRHRFGGHRESPQAKIREEMPRLTLRSRTGNFREVEEGFREAAACREAGRCLQCHREL